MKRKIVLASHGMLANGLRNTAEMIVGALPYETEVYTLQPGSLAEDYALELKKRIQDDVDTEYVILTDLYGASVFSAMFTCVDMKQVKLFSGMNLNMLLSVCLEHPEPLTQQDIEQILKDARSGIRYAEKQEEIVDDF